MDLRRALLDTRYLLTGAAVLFVAVAAMTGIGQTFGKTGDGLGIRRFVTPEIAPGWRVGERFKMDTGGLRAITIRPAVVGSPEGRVRLELRSVTPYAARVFRSAELPAAEFARANTYQFEFAAIPDSRDVIYQLDILSSPEAPSRGVALRATKGERLANGVLLINGVERWADLAFETDATQWRAATVKALASLAMLAVTWMAFALLLREIMRLK
jgi:hypothetical protein